MIENRIGTTRKATTKAYGTRTLEEQTAVLVARIIKHRETQRSLDLKPMMPTPYDPETAWRDGSVIVQPWVKGVRVLVYWHKKKIVIQSATNKIYDMKALTRYLQGKVKTSTGPLQPGTILDGWLVIPGKTPHEVIKVIRPGPKRVARDEVEFHVADVASYRPGGWHKRTGGIAKAIGGPVKRVPVDIYGPEVLGLNVCVGHIVRPADAPYRFGKCDSMQLIGEV